MTTILVVDDDPAVLLNTSAFLEDEGYDVLDAKTPQEAFDRISSDKPELAIVDMRLPGMDGNELIIKAHEINPDMQFIIHTGSTDYVLPDQLKKLGVTTKHVVHKPVQNMDVFERVIRELLTESGAES